MIKIRLQLLDMLEVGKKWKEMADVCIAQKIIETKIKNGSKVWRRFKVENWKTDNRLYRDAEVEPAILFGKLGQGKAFYRTQAEECEILMSCLRLSKVNFFNYINLKIYHFFRFFHRIFLENFISEFTVDARGNYLLSDVILFSMKTGQIYRNPTSATYTLAKLAKEIERSATIIADRQYELKAKAQLDRRQRIDLIAQQAESRKINLKKFVILSRQENTKSHIDISDHKIGNPIDAVKPRPTLLRRLAPSLRDKSSSRRPVYYLDYEYARHKISCMKHRARSLKCSSKDITYQRGLTTSRPSTVDENRLIQVWMKSEYNSRLLCKSDKNVIIRNQA